MRKRKGVILAVVCCCLLFTSVMGFANENPKSQKVMYEGISYNSVNFDYTQDLEKIVITSEKKSIRIQFLKDKQLYDINANLIGNDNNGNIKYSTASDGKDIVYNVLVAGENISGVCINKSISPINRGEDDAFGFAISAKIKKSVMRDTVKIAKSENIDSINSSISSMKEAPLKTIEDEVPSSDIQSQLRTTGLRVFISGLNIPFLICTGSSEGWVNTQYAYSGNYIVSGLQYVVWYNWPSDGVSLWSDYMGSVSEYHTPAWCSSELTSVSGSWMIDSSKGKFVAETTVSAVVRGFPLMWSLYDTSNIY